MSLFIVNQQKTKTKKLESCIEIKHNIDFNPNNFKAIEQPKYVNSSILIDGEVFGTYTTKEQTNKVFNEINKSIITEWQKKAQPSSTAKGSVKTEIVETDVVYEMPQDIDSPLP